MNQPNILLVLCDQLTAFATAPYGNEVALTPHMDELAASGAVVNHAYCNAPLCAPSRASLFTGQLSGRLPVDDNGEELAASEPTFAHVLRHGGYHAVMSGKMHFVGPDQYHGLEERLTTDIYPADFGWTNSWDDQGDPPRRVSDPTRAGLPEMAAMVTTAGPVSWSYQLDYDEEVHFRALERLRQFARRRGEAAQRPWMLCVSYTQPHDPYAPARDYWDRYSEVDVPLPDAPPDGYHPHISDVWANTWHGVDRVRPTPEQTRHMRRGYLGMISYIDDKLGQLCSELERLGIRDDTLVIFTSDHGDMAGEHGMFFKRTVREWATRVPLIVSGPGIPPGTRLPHPASLLDIFPTLIELAGVQLPGADVLPRLDGVSLAPALRGEREQIEHPVIIENNGEGTIAPIRAVVSGRWKFIATHGQPDQLYDLETDPGEWYDLAASSVHQAQRDRLRALCFADWNPDAKAAAVIASQRRRRFLRNAVAGGPQPAWDAQPEFDAARMYIRSVNNIQGSRIWRPQHDPMAGGR